MHYTVQIQTGHMNNAAGRVLVICTNEVQMKFILHNVQLAEVTPNTARRTTTTLFLIHIQPGLCFSDCVWTGAPEVLINLLVNSRVVALIVQSLWLSVSVCDSVQSVVDQNMFARQCGRV